MEKVWFDIIFKFRYDSKVNYFFRTVTVPFSNHNSDRRPRGQDKRPVGAVGVVQV